LARELQEAAASGRERSVKKIWFAAVACGVMSMGKAAETPAGLQWVYQYLLATSWTERELAPVTERIIKDELPNTQISDVAAEVLLARMGDGQFPLQNKLRLIRVLGADESGRYDALLTDILGKTTSSDVKKEAKSAIAGKPGATAYVPGSIDIRAIVNDMDAAALAAKPTSAQAEHLSQFPGGSIDELFEWAGRPQQIVSGQTRVSDGILIHIKVQRISFFYRGIGRVVYGYSSGFRREEDWLFQAVVADPLAFESEFSYRERAKELGMPDSPTLEMMQLVSGYTASMKNVVETNYRRESRPLEFMDTAAEILATQFKTANDPVTVDMYAWICRLLTMHGGQRYAAIVQRVASETPDSKLKRFAELPIEPTTEVPAEPYVPGTISLAAQRAKYPALYPESTFQSGRL
jgi:hypothetical protein